MKATCAPPDPDDLNKERASVLFTELVRLGMDLDQAAEVYMRTRRGEPVDPEIERILS